MSRFEVVVYPNKENASAKDIQSTLIYGFSEFETVASLYPECTIQVLNVDTYECRTYDKGKCIGVFY